MTEFEIYNSLNPKRHTDLKLPGSVTTFFVVHCVIFRLIQLNRKIRDRNLVPVGVNRPQGKHNATTDSLVIEYSHNRLPVDRILT